MRRASARCPRCQHDLLVPFSCKNRGLCPSCAGRRMAAQAAHLVDCILPAVPIRQFVLSFPFELSLLAATKPEVLRALARIHAEELARHYKQAAQKSGETGKLHAGAVTFVQRLGSSLNLHVHLRTCALDGVFVVVAACLAKDRTARLPSIGALAKTLEPFASSTSACA